jgi:[protein-PII] uridylyltransferase
MADLSVSKEQYRQDKQALWAHIASSTANGRSLKRSLMRLAHLADKLLIQLWNQAGFQNGECLVAVGGFGRGELFPSSDVDVLVLLPEHADPEASAALKAQLETFIGSCWDSGLEIGASVRNLNDCLEESAKDITVQTSLLESRYITGSKTLFDTFESEVFGTATTTQQIREYALLP